LRDAL